MENKLNVAVIQTDLVWENPRQNLAKFEKYFESLSTANLVVLPEMFTTGFTTKAAGFAESMQGNTVQWMKQHSSYFGFTITGSLIIKEDNCYFNRMLLVKPDGSVQFYDKRHLFKMGNEHISFSQGQNTSVFELLGWKIKPAICYDLRFPVWLRNTNEYDLLICVANWPAARSDVFNTLLKARAIENQCYVIGVNRVGTDGMNLFYDGHSQAIDARGQVIIDTKTETENVGLVTLAYNELHDFRAKFPVLNDADEFELQI